MIKSYSIFYYGVEITEATRFINFKESGDELTAELSVASYTPTSICHEVQSKLNAAGDLNYICTFDRSTRKITISASGEFSLLWGSGSSFPSVAAGPLGFGNSDLSGQTSYEGTGGVGSAWEPQFKLQDYVPPESYTQAVDESVHRAANGRVVVVKFGNESFIEFRVPYITNNVMPPGPIKNNQSGYEDAISFLNFAITKSPFEFMPDIDNRSEFFTVLLESTPESREGVGFKLRELFSQGLPGYYDTGVLKLRVL